MSRSIRHRLCGLLLLVTAGVGGLTCGGGGTEPSGGPSLSALSQDTVRAGSPGLVLTLAGHGFNAGTVAQWNGQTRTTTYGDSTSLQTSLTPADLADSGVGSISVRNQTGERSNQLGLTILQSVPIIVQLSPETAIVGDPAVTATVTGRPFDASMVVRWNGSDRLTTYVDSATLTVKILASDLHAAGDAVITVFSAARGASAGMPFHVLNPVAVVQSVNPATLMAGSGDTALTIIGTGLLATSVVTWDGTPVPTSWQFGPVRAQLSAALLTTAGPHAVRIVNPAPGGGTSAAWSYSVTPPPPPNPVPVIAAVSPDSLGWAAYSTSIAVQGQGFTAQSVVHWDGLPGTTAFFSDTLLYSSAPSPVLSQNGGTVQVTVVTPAPGGGGSNAIPIFYTPPTPSPRVRSLSPNFAVAGSGSITVTLHGSGFRPTSIVNWGQAPAPAFAILDDSTATLTTPPLDAESFSDITVTTFGGPAPFSRDTAVFTVVGPSTTFVAAYKMGAASVASDTVHGWLYVASRRGFLYTLDPSTGQIIDSIGANGPMGISTMSGDGTRLIAEAGGAIKWLDPSVPGSQLVSIINLSPTIPLYQILPVPGTPLSLATIWINQILAEADLIIWDGAVPRPVALDRILPPVAFIAPDTMIATTSQGTFLLSLQSDGLHGAAMPPGLQNFAVGDMAAYGRELILSTGEIVNLDTRVVSDTVPVVNQSSLTIDPGRGRLLAINEHLLQVFDIPSRQSLGPNLQLPAGGSPGATKVVRWGADGIAYADGGYLCILRTALVGP